MSIVGAVVGVILGFLVGQLAAIGILQVIGTRSAMPFKPVFGLVILTIAAIGGYLGYQVL